MWKDYQLTVNGLPQTVRYNEETVEHLFKPFLGRLNSLLTEERKRVIAFVAAPPATGKSTLLLFWQQLAEEAGIPFTAVGLDGFHYHNDYLDTHWTEREGKKITLQQVKGSPETFDAELLAEKLQLLAEGGAVRWPVYSRQIHDVLDEAQKVEGRLIVLEGNWLLLKEPRWKALRRFADYSLLIRADEAALAERLIQRKIQGGKTAEEARRFYEASDRANILRVLEGSADPDETWEMSSEGDYRLVSGKG